MNDYLDILENGTDDPDQLLRAAQWVARSGLQGTEASSVLAMAIDEFGPEAVYMDGEL